MRPNANAVNGNVSDWTGRLDGKVVPRRAGKRADLSLLYSPVGCHESYIFIITT